MTEHSAILRTVNAAPAGGETTADVLASIRRLIAQDETIAAPRRAARCAARPWTRHRSKPHLRPIRAPIAPLRLRRDTLIPPADAATEFPARRLRLATAEGGPIDESKPLTRIIRAATAARQGDAGRPVPAPAHVAADPARG